MINIIFSIILGWFTNVILKGVLHSIQDKKFSLHAFIHDGGMPSSHSAFVAALSTGVFLVMGVSLLFIVTVGFAIIVFHDAMNVRYQTGEHAKILKRLIGEKKFKEAGLTTWVGHTPAEVFVGVIVGILGCLTGYYLIF